MSTEDVIEAYPKTVNSLITFSSNPTTVVVPEYQRAYQWDSSKVEDMLRLTDPDDRSFGFIGTMVFVRRKHDNVLDVVDGQQRFLSIIISLCAFRDFLSGLEGKIDGELRDQIIDMRKDIQREYLLDKRSYSNAQGKPRIKFKRPAFKAFETIYLLADFSFESDDEDARQELKVFRRNYDCAKKYFQDKYPSIGRDTIDLLNKRLEKLQSLVVNAIYIKNHDFAGEVFESINGIGLPLKLSELVKNYIYRNVDPIIAKDKWQQIEKNCSNKLDYIGMLIKYDWQSREDISDEYEIFRKIRKSTDASHYLDTLLRSSKILAFYLDPSVDKFKLLKVKDNSNDKNHTIKYASTLRLLGVRQFIRIVATVDTLNGYIGIKDYNKLLGIVASFQVRAQISSIGTNAIDNMYSRTSRNLRKIKDGIDSGKVPDSKAKDRVETELFDQLHASMKKLSLDEEFRDHFARFDRKRTTKKYLYKYLLSSIENYLQRQELIIDVKDNSITLEEIYPQTPSNKWGSSDCDDEDTYKLANATILKGKANLTAGNEPITKKAEIYKESNLLLNKDLVKIIGQNPTWNKDKIRERGVILGNLAPEIWKL